MSFHILAANLRTHVGFIWPRTGSRSLHIVLPLLPFFQQNFLIYLHYFCLIRQQTKTLFNEYMKTFFQIISILLSFFLQPMPAIKLFMRI